jgi:hypothetical protein
VNNWYASLRAWLLSRRLPSVDKMADASDKPFEANSAPPLDWPELERNLDLIHDEVKQRMDTLRNSTERIETKAIVLAGFVSDTQVFGTWPLARSARHSLRASRRSYCRSSKNLRSPRLSWTAISINTGRAPSRVSSE